MSLIEPGFEDGNAFTVRGARRPRGKTVLLLSTITVIDEKDSSLWTPLSILAIGTELHARGFKPILLDTQVDVDWRERISSQLSEVLLFGVSTLTGPSIATALEAIQLVRSVRPDVPIVWGGYHASLAKRWILQEGWANYVVRGVGEPAIIALTEALAEDSGLDDADRESKICSVPNLSFRSGGAIVDTPTVSVEMDELPPLNYSLIDPARYYTSGRRNVSYISSYSCPWRCSYCVEPMHTGRIWRGLSPARVAREVRALWTTYAPDYIDFVDPNFSSSPKRVVEIVHELVNLDIRPRIACNMRASDVVHIAEMIDLRHLRAAGIHRIFLGLESGSDRMLLGILQKDSPVEHARRATRLLDAAGIEQFSSFIHDIPTETDEDSELTLHLAEELALLPHNRQFHHFFIPFPGTTIYETLLRDAAIDESRLRLRDWAKANTYGGWSELWRGRPTFRQRVLTRLESLSRRYPHTFSYPQTLPSLAV